MITLFIHASCALWVMYLAVSLLTVDPNRRLRENATTNERGKEQKKDAKNVPGIRADYARRERCTRVPLLFVDVVGTDVPTNADRMEREENMMIPFSLFFPRLLWRICCMSFFLAKQKGEVFSWFPSHEIDSSKKEERRKERQRCVRDAWWNHVVRLLHVIVKIKEEEEEEESKARKNEDNCHQWNLRWGW